MRLWNSGTYALYVQGQNLVPIPVLHSFLFSFKVIGSFHLSQVGAELIDKTWVGWAHVFGLWKSQSIGVNTGFPRWESCCSWNKRKLLQTDSQGYQTCYRQPGQRGICEQNRTRQEAEPGRNEFAFLGCLAPWEYCNGAADRGEFWRGHCFHEVLFWKRFPQSCLRAWPTWQNHLTRVSGSVANRLPTS